MEIGIILYLPKRNDSFILLQCLSLTSGEYYKAIDLYLRLIEIDPDNPEGYYGIGCVFYALKRNEESIEYIDKAIEKYKKYNSKYIYDAYYVQGLNYYSINDWVKTIEYLELAQKKYSNNDDIKNIINDAKSRIKNNE